MKADRNSPHAKLYEFTYTSNFPSNLCPYFWKLIWAIIILIPNFIIQLPALIINLFRRGSYDCSDFRVLGILIYILLMFLYVYGMGTFNWVKAIFNCYSYNQELAIIGGGFNSIIFGGLSLFFIIRYFKNKKPKLINEEKKPNIVAEFIKAKYNRYCPKIDWE